jgi:mersacidin/lichenicidin family type 2 lantibiotic
MSIEHIINAWKADEDDQDTNSATNPIGEELTDQELQEISGGGTCIFKTCAFVDTIPHCGTGSMQ